MSDIPSVSVANSLGHDEYDDMTEHPPLMALLPTDIAEGVPRGLAASESVIDYTVLSVSFITLGLILLVELLRQRIDQSAHGRPFAKTVLEGVYRECKFNDKAIDESTGFASTFLSQFISILLFSLILLTFTTSLVILNRSVDAWDCRVCNFYCTYLCSGFQSGDRGRLCQGPLPSLLHGHYQRTYERPPRSSFLSHFV